MYGKLTNGIYAPVPHCIVQGGRQIINPTDEMLAQAGYMEVVDTPQPSCNPVYQYLEDSYTVEGGKIYHTWTVVTQPLEPAQAALQDRNKQALAAHLAAHPLQWQDGKYYGVTEADQSEISLNMMQYQLATQAGIPATLEWHAVREACTVWTVEQLTALTLAIAAYVYPYMRQMQITKQQIYAATTHEALEAIEIVYT